MGFISEKEAKIEYFKISTNWVFQFTEEQIRNVSIFFHVKLDMDPSFINLP